MSGRLTLEDLHDHARRFGVDGIWETALEAGYTPEALLAFAEALARLDDERRREEIAARVRHRVEDTWHAPRADLEALRGRQEAAERPNAAISGGKPGFSAPKRPQIQLVEVQTRPDAPLRSRGRGTPHMSARQWRRSPVHAHSRYGCSVCGDELSTPAAVYRHLDTQHA